MGQKSGVAILRKFSREGLGTSRIPSLASVSLSAWLRGRRFLWAWGGEG